MMRLYISGPMTGLLEDNFPAFNAEAARLRALGYDVVNPAELNPPGRPYKECLRNDIAHLMTCDTLALIDGWMYSNGAHDELHTAHRCGIEIVLSATIVDPLVIDCSAGTDGAERAFVYDLVAHLHRQREFSLRTFGPGSRAEGVIDHITRELIEVAEDPADVFEWIDIALLAFDGAWRAGHTPEAIARALLSKQERNERRQWPDWRTAEPGKAIQHVREVAC